jgi:hypothetical protein
VSAIAAHRLAYASGKIDAPCTMPLGFFPSADQ